MSDFPENDSPLPGEALHSITPVSGLYQNWFLDYASYVIMERAVPLADDGLKPVQRRILHSLKEVDDGRFNKVANIIGHTMQYHPHGDAAIGEAMVNLGQKDLLIETQGNWGDITTGDGAAAARYIEARLSKFALEVAFNGQTTEWQASYDGRRKEPVALPMKFPLLLAQGVDGIAVGLSTKVLPHNFCELIKASIDVLRGRPTMLYPDFLQGGLLDVAGYNDGQRGGRVRVRARIEEVDKKTLAIREVPYGTTTGSLVESIIKATEAGKLKIKKVIDNTAAKVEIQIQLAPGVSPDLTIDALYAFTDCEVSHSPNACVIADSHPQFLCVTDLLRMSTERTKSLLKQELDIRLGELANDWHFSSLEKIFIENRIYRDIEECETWEAVLQAIDGGLEPHKPLLRREVTTDDIVRLTEIKIKRISRFDAFKADEHIRALEVEMEEVENHLAHLTDFAVKYFESLLKKYGKGRERRTEIRTFDTIQATAVAIANQKLYVNRAEGFVGTGLKKDEPVLDVSDLDWIATFRENGTFMVTRVAEKTFVGKDIVFVDVYRKGDDRRIYHMVYVDGATGISYAKRFNIQGVTLNKEYNLVKEAPKAKVHYFSMNPNAESEQVLISLHPAARAKQKEINFDFGSLGIKARSSQGNIATRYPIKRVLFKGRGQSTVGGRALWFDEVMGRLNTDKRGRLLGIFDNADRLLAIYTDGTYELLAPETTHHFEVANLVVLQKFDPQRPISVLHTDGTKKETYAKRFLVDTTTLDKRFSFISDEKGSKLNFASYAENPVVELVAGKKRADATTLHIEFGKMEVKGRTALGSRVATLPVLEVVEHQQETPGEEPETESDLILEVPENAKPESGIESPQSPTEPTLF